MTDPDLRTWSVETLHQPYELEWWTERRVLATRVSQGRQFIEPRGDVLEISSGPRPSLPCVVIDPGERISQLKPEWWEGVAARASQPTTHYRAGNRQSLLEYARPAIGWRDILDNMLAYGRSGARFAVSTDFQEPFDGHQGFYRQDFEREIDRRFVVIKKLEAFDHELALLMVAKPHVMPLPLTGATTHADHGEDIILKVMLDTLGMERPSWLDIGAHHPFHINNTAALYAAGGRGINIEANPALIKAFKTHRKHDINLCCAVGPERQASRRLYLSKNDGLSSLRKELVDDPDGVIDVQTWTIPDILAAHHNGKWPDLLTIDIEGEDLAVIEACLPASGDRPIVVCVEYMRGVEKTSSAWRMLMPTRGYSLAFRTRSNMIWVTNEAREWLL